MGPDKFAQCMYHEIMKINSLQKIRDFTVYKNFK